MATPINMPQLGETVVEGTIVKWLKAEGDTIERDEPLFEISTDKVDTEVPSPVAGVIQKIVVPEGETVSVGTELAIVDEGGSGNGQASGDGQAAEAEAETEPKAEAKTEAKAEAEAEPEPAAGDGDDAVTAPAEAPSGGTSGGEQKAREPEPASTGPARREDRASRPARGPSGRGPRSQILSPLVRRLAEEHDVDLSQVEGTGTGGRITKKDVLAFVETGGGGGGAAAGDGAALRPVPQEAPERAAPPAQAPAAGEREETVPISHIRKRIAENMVASLHQSARAWNMVEVNMENIVKLRTRAKDAFKQSEGFSLTYLPFLGRAVSDALLAFPDVNAHLNLDDGTVTHRRYVNLGIAVAYEDGLIVPIIKGAEEMNLVGLARAVNDLAVRARSKKLQPDEVHGGTFTITNPGPFGSILSVPIMNPGETGILAFDAIEKRAVVIDDAIAIRSMVYLSMSWDHRAIDGAIAAQFLGRLKQNLETWDFTPEVQGYLS